MYLYIQSIIDFSVKNSYVAKRKKRAQQQENMLEKKLNKNDNYLQTKGNGIVYIRTMNKGNIREEDIDWINIYISTPSPIAILLLFFIKD